MYPNGIQKPADPAGLCRSLLSHIGRSLHGVKSTLWRARWGARWGGLLRMSRNPADERCVAD
jgi:hypothetical protein